MFYPILRLDVGRVMYLDNIVVRNKHQRKGVAKALMHAVREAASSMGIKLMAWEVLSKQWWCNNSCPSLLWRR